MIEYCLRNSAELYIQQLVDKHLCYGIKSPDMDLYDFGFSRQIESDQKSTDYLSYILHITCEFKIIGKNNVTDYYDANTPSNQFSSNIQKLIGLKVQRVTLSEKNDLWLDLGKCWVVFITFETDEESWRFFTSSKGNAHLVASNSWLQKVF